MSVIILVALVALLWYIVRPIHQHNKERAAMSPQMRQALDTRYETRKAYIIEDGRRQFEEYKKQHPFLGSLRKYDANSYWIKNCMNAQRYPY